MAAALKLWKTSCIHRPFAGAATRSKPSTQNQSMKSILRALAEIVLLPVTGCIFPGNRDYLDDCTLMPVRLDPKNKGLEQKDPNNGNCPIPAQMPAYARRA